MSQFKKPIDNLLNDKNERILYLEEENETLRAALLELKRWRQSTIGGYEINNAPMSIINKALGDES